jgi:tripeptidyl-peptidase-2
LYVREQHEFKHLTEWTLEVTPIFENDIDKKRQIDFEIWLNLKSTLPGVIVPKHCVLSSAGRSFKVRFNPSSFEAGTLHYGEIQGFDSQHPERGPLLRVPLTIVKPL